MTFYRNCEKKVKSQAKFYYSYRQALPASASPQSESSRIQPLSPVSQAKRAEKVIGVIQNLKKPKSFGRWDLHAVVVTDKRSIFAQITSDMLKEATKQAAKKARAEGKSWTQTWAAQLDMSANYARKYLNMNPEQVIGETVGNFTLDNLAISEIRVTSRKMRNFALCYYEIDIKSMSGSFTYQTEYDPQGVLRQVYREKVKTGLG